jgi:hypothetical protein
LGPQTPGMLRGTVRKPQSRLSLKIGISPLNTLYFSKILFKFFLILPHLTAEIPFLPQKPKKNSG